MKFWSQPLRVENEEQVQFITCRCAMSALWFVNNQELEERILAFLAKYAEIYGVIIYGFQLVGNHFHMVVSFPNQNRAAFMRDLNARIAESVRLLVDNFISGTLFERRYTPQVLPENEDVEKYFLYTALQPVSSGLCARISEYPGYNFFNDAVSGRVREYKYFAFGEYNQALKRNPKAKKKDYWRKYKLQFSRLPQYKNLPQEDYKTLMYELLENRRAEIVKDSKARFRTKSELRQIRPGTLPYKTKKGSRRPLVLTSNPRARERYLEWYFDKVEKFKEACAKYRRGELSVEFPPGTYRPPGLAIYKTQ